VNVSAVEYQGSISTSIYDNVSKNTANDHGEDKIIDRRKHFESTG